MNKETDSIEIVALPGDVIKFSYGSGEFTSGIVESVIIKKDNSIVYNVDRFGFVLPSVVLSVNVAEKNKGIKIKKLFVGSKRVI
jgi:hypothetical protein